MTIHVYLFLTGVLAGGVGALLGVGGGFIAVPIMFMLLGLSPQVAVGVSLTMAFFNSLSGSLTFWRQKRIDLVSGWKFALATIPGAIFGSHLAGSFTDRSFGIVFGLLLLALALLMYRNSMTLSKKPAEANQNSRASMFNSGWVTRDFVDAQGNGYCYSFNEYWGIGASLGVGFISSVLGIGGGIIHMPFMVMVLKFPPHIAAATSLFILSWSSLIGAGTHFILGHFEWPMAISLAAGGVLGAQFGAVASRRLTPVYLVKLFAVVMVLVGMRLVLG
jgi:uncharacterized membrane protein YfcA